MLQADVLVTAAPGLQLSRSVSGVRPLAGKGNDTPAGTVAAIDATHAPEVAPRSSSGTPKVISAAMPATNPKHVVHTLRLSDVDKSKPVSRKEPCVEFMRARTPKSSYVFSARTTLVTRQAAAKSKPSKPSPKLPAKTPVPSKKRKAVIDSEADDEDDSSSSTSDSVSGSDSDSDSDASSTTSDSASSSDSDSTAAPPPKARKKATPVQGKAVTNAAAAKAKAMAKAKGKAKDKAKAKASRSAKKKDRRAKKELRRALCVLTDYGDMSTSEEERTAGKERMYDGDGTDYDHYVPDSPVRTTSVLAIEDDAPPFEERPATPSDQVQAAAEPVEQRAPTAPPVSRRRVAVSNAHKQSSTPVTASRTRGAAVVAAATGAPTVAKAAPAPPVVFAKMFPGESSADFIQRLATAKAEASLKRKAARREKATRELTLLSQ